MTREALKGKTPRAGVGGNSDRARSGSNRRGRAKRRGRNAAAVEGRDGQRESVGPAVALSLNAEGGETSGEEPRQRQSPSWTDGGQAGQMSPEL